MAKACAITGKSSQVGGGYSNRVRATKFNPTGSRRRYANLQTKTYLIPELDKKMTITLSTRGMKKQLLRRVFIRHSKTQI